MMSIKAMLLLLLLSLASVARCDDLDEEINVETEEQAVPPEAEDVEDATKLSKASPDADVASYLVQLDNGALPSNEFITVLVGFSNTGEKDLIVDGIEASFRYPQDFNYFIQNFTHYRYNRVIAPKTESSFMYRFFIHESYHSRSMGLSVNVNYHNVEGKIFESAAFNETIRIAEPVEGFDAEAFFLYVLLAAVVSLIAFGGYQVFQSFGRRKSSKPSAPVVETGTGKSDVDTEWLPKELLASLNRSPAKSKSPKKEANGNKRSPGNSDSETRQRRSQGTKLVE